MEIVIKAGISSKSQMFQFITEIFYSCLWPTPCFGHQNAEIKQERGKPSSMCELLGGMKNTTSIL